MISPAYGHDPVFPPSGQFDDGLDPVDLVPGDPRGAMSLQTAWLKSFLAVADCGGFGAATLGLHLSQSRVSAHIAALVDRLVEAVGVRPLGSFVEPHRDKCLGRFHFLPLQFV